MKFSIATNIPIEFFGEEKGLELLANTGFDTVDYSFFIPEEDKRLLEDDYMEQAERTRLLLERFGLSCNQAHAGFKFRYGMEMSTECPEYLFSCRCIEYAAHIGAKDIILHTVRVPKEAEDFVDYNIRFFKSLEPLCEKFGIRIAVENASGATSIDKINRFCEALSPEHFVVCLDIGHAQVSELAPCEFARKISSERLQALHVHDNCGTKDDHTLPYLGVVDWDATLQALIDIGYEGDFNMEAGKFLRAFPKELIPEALKLYYSVTSYLAHKFEEMRGECQIHG